MPRQVSSVLEVYTVSTLPIATLQVHCHKKLLRLGLYYLEILKRKERTVHRTLFTKTG